MSTLGDRLQSDLTEAIRSRDELRSSTLRMALSAIKNESVSGQVARELSDEDVVRVLAKEAKKRKEAADAYEEAGRPDRAERELAEGGVLADYLPTALAPDEIAEIVAAAVATVAEGGATGPRAMGAVMKLISPQVTGRADGTAVANAVKAALAQG